MSFLLSVVCHQEPLSASCSWIPKEIPLDGLGWWEIRCKCGIHTQVHANTNSTVSENPNPFLCLATETPDCAGEDGAEGAVSLHPSAHVLGSLWPAGNYQFSPSRLLYVTLKLKKERDNAHPESKGGLKKSCVSSTGLKMDPPGDHHGRKLCECFVCSICHNLMSTNHRKVF